MTEDSDIKIWLNRAIKEHNNYCENIERENKDYDNYCIDIDSERNENNNHYVNSEIVREDCNGGSGEKNGKNKMRNEIETSNNKELENNSKHKKSKKNEIVEDIEINIENNNEKNTQNSNKYSNENNDKNINENNSEMYNEIGILKINNLKIFSLGLDAEWPPTYGKNEKNNVALIQLATPHTAIIIQISQINIVNIKLLLTLEYILECGEIRKVGVGIQDDLIKIKDSCGKNKSYCSCLTVFIWFYIVYFSTCYFILFYYMFYFTSYYFILNTTAFTTSSPPP